MFVAVYSAMLALSSYDDDNLSCNRIISLEQDAYGFIWIATEDGLNKFDGYTFTNYFHDESDSTSIACNYINKVYSDSHQRLWVASNKGIQYYLPQQNLLIPILMLQL